MVNSRQSTLAGVASIIFCGATLLAVQIVAKQPQLAAQPQGTGKDYAGITSEIELGDPDQLPSRGERLEISGEALRTIRDVLSREPRSSDAIDKKRLAERMLALAESCTTSIKTPPPPQWVSRDNARGRAEVAKYLKLFGFGLKYSRDGKWVPYCASGIAYVACQAYAEQLHMPPSTDPTGAYRGLLSTLHRKSFLPHPACRVMVADAKRSRIWISQSSAWDPKRRVANVKPGWLVFYNWTNRKGGGPTSARGVAQHVGIVRFANGQGLSTVEFNTSARDEKNRSNGGAVAIKAPKLRPYKYVLGYIKTY